MGDPLAAVEAAIQEVSTARNLLTRRKSKQVFRGDEQNQLKAVAFSWFRTHRLIVMSHPSTPDISNIDVPYQRVLDSTARNAARSTYASGLLEAKKSLVALRGQLAIADKPKVTTDAPPNFAPLAPDTRMQGILKNRWDEVQRCIACSASLSATVMMGGLLESLLLARINSSPAKPSVFTAVGAPRDSKTGKTLPLPNWKLIHMVEVGHELKWISKSAKDIGHVLREFRNYIHPEKEFTDNVTISQDDATMFWEVTKAITRQVLASVGKSP